MRRKLKWIAIAIVVIFIGLQFKTMQRTNPPVDPSQTIEGVTAVPPAVSAVFERSCNDCHSNKTNWRWYTYVAPVSWFTVGHVDEGRSELNFSEWGSYTTRKKGTRLNAICAETQRGDMPLTSYALVHREVKLTPEEVKAICEWTENAKKQLESTSH